jgi:CheY-like chemotaxis protein
MQTESPRGRIAVIDDDMVFVELMRDLLAEGEGYEVLSAPNWLHSVEFVKESRPDLIILDVMLGRDQSGWGVLELLRSEPGLADIPVIMCSAAAPALNKCAGVAAVEAVAKPFDVDYLLGVVERLLAQAQAKAIA